MTTVVRHRTYFICFILAFIVLLGLLFFSFSTDAETTKSYQKYFHTIQVQSGDSLWSIADDYMSEQYSSVDEYISEICQLNHIDGNIIQDGWNLLIPYYATTPDSF